MNDNAYVLVLHFMGQYRAGDTDSGTEMDERKPSIVVKSFIDTEPESTASQEGDSEGDENDPFADIPLLPQSPGAARICKTLPKRKTALGSAISLPPSITPPAIRNPLKSGGRYNSTQNRRSVLVQSDIIRKRPRKSTSLDNDNSTTESLKAHIYNRQPSLKVEGNKKKRNIFKVKIW